MNKKERAIKWITEELRTLRLAPVVNGCEMKPEWSEQIEVWETALEALKSGLHESKSGKTADEMFRELGYCEKGTVGCGVRYDTKEKVNGFFSAKAIVLNTKEGVSEKAEYPNGFGRPFEFAEICAVCKLLDEMGGGVNGLQSCCDRKS